MNRNPPIARNEALRALGREFWAWLNHPFTLGLAFLLGVAYWAHHLSLY